MTTITLYGDRERRRACDMIETAVPLSRVTIADPKHSDQQRGRLNAMCQEVAAQQLWHGQRLHKDDWRHIFAAALFKLRIVPALEGDGFLTLTPSTARMSRNQMSNLIDLIAAWGADPEHLVVFRDDDATPSVESPRPESVNGHRI